MRHTRSGLRPAAALLLVVALLVAACSGDDEADGPGATSTTTAPPTEEAAAYRAVIRRTSYGVPHVTADDWGSLGFGQGYAFAQAHLCTLADQVVKVRSERARWFGPGEDGANLDSDFAYLALGLRDRAERDVDSQPPEVRAVVAGYAAGYNAYLAETGVDALPGWCRGADWVRPVTDIDLYAYYRDLGLLASSRPLLGFIADARPPAADDAAAPTSTEQATALPDLAPPDVASNGWALGAEATVDGRGALLANPHFPWLGELRLWESHLTIPGELDVYGASLLGTPGILVGFNEHVAWTHTVSAGNRFTGYRLSLVPGDPTRYRYGDEERSMEATTHTIEVRTEDGAVEPVERTTWSSHYGPMIAVPGLEWSTTTAYTYRDANIDNDEMLAQFLGMDRAADLDQFQAVHREVGGIPWVNTIAADDTGRAWYADASATPALSDDAIARWKARLGSDPVVALAYDNGLVLLDGSDPADEWQELPGARDPGLLPFEQQPQIERRDHVFNANDSHWVPHATERLEGYSPLTGFEREKLSLRTRANLAAIAELREATPDDLAAIVVSNESYTAEQLLPGVLERCASVDAGSAPARGCAVLAEWDGRFDLASSGAVLFQQMVRALPEGSLGDGADSLWAVPFDPERPATTPSGLAPPAACPTDAPCADAVVTSLGRAVESMEAAGLALDVPLGDVQWASKGEDRVPIHGGTDLDGVMNVVSGGGTRHGTTLEPPLEEVASAEGLAGLGPDGVRIVDGTSFLLAVAFGDDGPEGKVLLTYSQSDDPTSDALADQTWLFSEKQWRPILFRSADIDDDPEMEEFEVRSPR